jgi:hypothetical protein
MPRIFVSYRRADSITITGRIYDRLVDAFGEQYIFKDVDDIPVGVDFRAVLNREVSSADVLLVIIGKEWVSTKDDNGRRRLDDANDFVRIEVEHGLSRKAMLVIPVLVNGAGVPSAADLPPSLHELAFRNAAVIRDDPDFRRDMTRLIEQINRYVEQEPPTTRLKPVQPAASPPAAAPAPVQPVVNRDPFEDLVPMNPQPVAQSTFTPAPSQQFPLNAPKAASQTKWLWIGIGAFILLAVGCFVCQYVSSLQGGFYYY